VKNDSENPFILISDFDISPTSSKEK